MKSCSALLKTVAFFLGILAVSSLSGIAPFSAAAEPASRDRASTIVNPLIPVSAREGRERWRKYLKLSRLPRRGCFTATYPSTQWHEIPCKTGPLRPYLPRQLRRVERRGGRPQIVGNTNGDFSAETGGTIAWAQGSFDPVNTVVTSETGVGTDPSNPPPSDSIGPNHFALQLNANTFNTAKCQNATVSGCVGWQQFIFSNDGQLTMQYWLINFGPSCPDGFMSFNTAANPNDCFANGVNQAAPSPITNISELAELSLTASAVAGGEDTLIFTNGDVATSFSNDDGVVDLAKNWKEAEFNVFGDGFGNQANFNAGAKIAVNVVINDGTSNAPICDPQSFTGETNNLTLSNTPAIAAQPAPTMAFNELSTPVPPGTCATSGGNAQDVGVVYRWYSPSSGDHFYTEDPTGELAPNNGYHFEGTPFSLFTQGTPGTTAFFRWYCPSNGHHFYTTDPSGEAAPQIGCHLENTLGFIATSQLAGTVALYRWYNSGNGDHFYTTDPHGELAVQAGYHFESVPGFVKPGP